MLLDASTSLPDGRRLRVRLPHAGDRVALIALHERLGMGVEELDLARVLRFDPRRRAVVCATTFDGHAEVPVALGAIDLGTPNPDLLIVDEATAPGVATVVLEALLDRARSSRHAVA